MTDSRPALTEVGTIQDVPVSVAFPRESPAQRPALQLLTLGELLDRPAPRYLIQDMIPEQALAVLYGQPATAKTFLALSLALSIAAGRPWHSHPVLRGSVVYVAAEGVRGLRQRIQAWLSGELPEVHDRVRAALRFLPTPVDMLGAGHAELLAAMSALPESPVLVVIDTLARCFSRGDENSSADMGLFVSNCDTLRTAFGASVLIVHHRSQSGEERGSTALRGAADTMMRADRTGNLVTVTCSKQKDAAPFAPLAFRIEPVALDLGPDDMPQSSCRMLLAETNAPRGPRESADAIRLTVAKTLRDTFGSRETTAAALHKVTGIPRATLATHLSALRSEGCIKVAGRGKATRYRFVRLPGSGGSP